MVSFNPWILIPPSGIMLGCSSWPLKQDVCHQMTQTIEITLAQLGWALL